MEITLRLRRKRRVRMTLGVSVEFSDPFGEKYSLLDFMEGCKDGKYQFSWDRGYREFIFQNDPEFTHLYNTPGIYSLKNRCGESDCFYIKDKQIRDDEYKKKLR